MNLEQLAVDRSVAEKNLKAYKGISPFAREADPRYAALERLYEVLANGRPVLHLPTILAKGGFHPWHHLPKLGFGVAGYATCRVDVERHQVSFTSSRGRGPAESTFTFAVPVRRSTKRGSEHIPVIPPVHIPRGDLNEYRLLWEANWQLENHEPERGIDPALLRRIGSNFYELLAVWDMTPLEALALSMHE